MSHAPSDNSPAWLKESVIIQPWSDEGNEDLYVKYPEKRIPVLKRFKINTIALIPTEAHNQMSHQYSKRTPKSRLYTDEQFTAAVKAYQKAGIRVQIYTCLGHLGHHPSWQDITRKHPEWLARDKDGKPFFDLGGDWFCPNNDEPFLHVANYTCDLVRQYDPDAILLDNNFMIHFQGFMSCYCDACQEKFRQFAKKTLKLKTKNIRIPEERNSELYEHWIDWRYAILADWTRRLRNMLKAVKPDVALIPNLLWSYDNWTGADEDQCPVVDANLRECYGAPAKIGAYATMGRAFGNGKRHTELFLCTWETTPKRYAMLPPEPIKASLAAAVSHLGSPWLVAYGGWDIDESTASSKAMKQYLNFFHRHREFFRNAEPYTGMALCNSRETLDHAPDQKELYRRKMYANLLALLDLHIPFGFVHTKHTDPAMLKRYKALLFPKPECVSDRTMRDLATFVQNGGTVIFTEGYGDRDQLGRKRPRPALERLFGKDIKQKKQACLTIRRGKGRAVLLRRDPADRYLAEFRWERTGQMLLDVIESVPGARTIDTQNCPAHVEIFPTVQKVDRKTRYVLHVVNNNGTGMLRDIGINLRARAGFKAGRVALFTPDGPDSSGLPFKQNSRNIAFTLPKFEVYSVVVVTARRAATPTTPGGHT